MNVMFGVIVFIITFATAILYFSKIDSVLVFL